MKKIYGIKIKYKIIKYNLMKIKFLTKKIKKLLKK